MTNGQKWIMRFIENYLNRTTATPDATGKNVTITDSNGQAITLTLNVYGDIINADTKQIMAESNLKHDANSLLAPVQEPDYWTIKENDNI